MSKGQRTNHTKKLLNSDSHKKSYSCFCKISENFLNRLLLLYGKQKLRYFESIVQNLSSYEIYEFYVQNLILASLSFFKIELTHELCVTLYENLQRPKKYTLIIRLNFVIHGWS